MEKANFFTGDIDSILSKIKHQQKQIQQKRRWLLGLSTSEEQYDRSKRLKFLDTNSMPESFLREDDIFYETVKSCVEEAFGVSPEIGHQAVLGDLQLLGVSDVPKAISSCIDNLTTKGLYLLAKTLTGGRMDFEKTRPKMKRVVRESLSVVFRSQKPNHHHNHHLMQLSRQIAQLLNDPRSFRDNHVPLFTSRFSIQRAAATKVLAELWNFPQQTLVAMHRKLRGVQPSTPQLQPQKNGRCKDYLISRVRKYSKEMLSELDRGDDLPEPLARAMAIAELSLKLKPGFHNASATEFYKFSPEVKLLQGEITKAIRLVKTKVGIGELKNVKNLLDPNVKVSNRCLRSAIRNMLTEYLFACSDMDAVPKSLLEILAIINKNRTVPDECHLKNVIEDEMECILNLSAHTKQVLLDLLPANDFDVDFTDAYVEFVEESDDEHSCINEDCYIDDGRGQDDNMSQNGSCHSVGSNQEVESTADSVPFEMKGTPATAAEEDPCTLTPNERSDSVLVGLASRISTKGDTANFSFGETGEPKEMDEDKQNTRKNCYLAIQEACDRTSMVAYNLIGQVLEELGHKEGLDLQGDCENKEQDTREKERDSPRESDGMIIVRVTEELISSFPKSEIRRLKKLISPR